MGNNMDNQGRRKGEARPVLPNMRPIENPGGRNGDDKKGKNPLDDVRNAVNDKVHKIINK